MTWADYSLNRRDVLKGIGASAFAASIAGLRAHAADYQRADAGWLAACRFGISTHWTAQSKPVGADDWLPFEETVNNFSPQRYVDQIADAGANYVIFTGAHALQMLPAPCAAIDRVLGGRTTKRDLIGELADACHTRGLHFILYYNHSCNSGEDPDWEHAVGYHRADKSTLVSNVLGILGELGARYGSRVEGWWFDSCYSMDARGVHSSVTTDMHGFQFPWDDWVEAAKTGYSNRLVTLNPGVMIHYLYSTHQDYEAGEANDMIAVPTTQFTPEHLQSHRWICLDNSGWVHSKVMTPLMPPRYRADLVTDYVRMCNQVKVPVTFNVDIERGGLLSPESLALLRQVRNQLG